MKRFFTALVALALTAALAAPIATEPVMAYAPDSAVKTDTLCEGRGGWISYGSANDGYITVYAETGWTSYKCVVRQGTKSRNHTIEAGKTLKVPLGYGSGKYDVVLYKSLNSRTYSSMAKCSFEARFGDNAAIWTEPDMYSDWDPAGPVAAKAADACKGLSGDWDKAKAIYGAVTGALSYDRALAKTATAAYVPDPETVWTEGKGICFGIASVMTAMCRSQGIPCKLVIGYVSGACHAWASAYISDGKGGGSWTRFDPTYGLSRDWNKAWAYMSDDSNYIESYCC